MNSIVEETALPTTTSDPDVEPTYIEGKPLSPRLDRVQYEYDDEPSIDQVMDQQSVGSSTIDGESLSACRASEKLISDDETMSIARTFGVRSRAGNSLRHHSSFDSSLRQKVPIPASPNQTSTALPSAAPTVPPKSPNRHTADHLTFDEFQAGPSTRQRPVSMFITPSVERAESSGYAGTFNAGPESHGSDTPRSTTPASSFYAKPKRKMGQVKSRGSSLLDLNANGGDEPKNQTPRNSIPRSSDEGFDSQSNSTGSHSLRSHMSVPVDANLRSMPGVVGIGEGWAGGPQGQDKKRRLWFRRKPSKKPEEDPLALWSIQESDPVPPSNGKVGQKKGVLKEAWNRSIGRFGSTPMLLSGDQANGSGGKSGGIKEFFSRSRLDLVNEKDTQRPEDPRAQEKKEKRQTIAFFGSSKSKSQVELTTPRARPVSTFAAQTPQSPSPPSPSPAPRTSTPLANGREATFVPISIPDHSRRLSAPLSAPAAPGGLPPPWRPISFVIPRPLGSPAPRSFSRHEDRAIVEEPERIDHDDQIPSLSNTPGAEGLQQSISSAGVETPRTRTNSAEGRSLRHKRSTRLFEDESDLETPRPKSSLARSNTPYTTTPLNESTPGLDTLHDWANEGKRPSSRAFRPAQDAPPKFPEPPRRSQTPTWGRSSFFDRIKQAFTPVSNVETPRRGKDLPELPSRTSTPIMPGAYPDSRPHSSMGMMKDDPLPPSPYDITKAVAREMMATPSPTRPSSRASVRKRGLSADLWPRLTKIREGGDTREEGDYTRPTSRLEKRNSYATLAGRFGFGRTSSFGAQQSLSVSTTNLDESEVPPVSSPPITPLTVRDFGEDDLGLEDILDSTRRMTLVRDLEAALPLPPARADQGSPMTIASSPKTVSSSEATVMAASPNSNTNETEDKGHRNHPSTSTAATFDLDELMTPADIRKSFEKTVGARRGSQQSDKLSFDAEGNIVDTSSRRHWPTRKHTRNTSIGERASELLNTTINKSRTSLNLKPTQEYLGQKRGSVDRGSIDIGDEEDEMRIREREERTMSFASQMSDMSSAMSLDEEEAGTSILLFITYGTDIQYLCLLSGSPRSNRSNRGRLS
jgi:hypothetical protein